MKEIGYMPLNGGVHGPSDQSSKRPVATSPQPVFLIFGKLGNWQLATGLITIDRNWELQSSCDQLRSSPVASLCTSCQLDFETLCVIVYLDNILIYSEDKASHREHIREVLQHLRKHGLYAKPEKCEFHTDSTEYLGYCLSPSGLTMSEVKVQAIQDWPEPRKVKDIQSFLGFANFYHHFIFNYSEITIPLTRLTHKDTPWNFSDDCRSAFQCLKDTFTSALILTHYIPDAPLLVETDASDYAIAGILSICCLDEELWPVVFFS